MATVKQRNNSAQPYWTWCVSNTILPALCCGRDKLINQSSCIYRVQVSGPWWMAAVKTSLKLIQCTKGQSLEIPGTHCVYKQVYPNKTETKNKGVDHWNYFNSKRKWSTCASLYNNWKEIQCKMYLNYLRCLSAWD